MLRTVVVAVAIVCGGAAVAVAIMAIGSGGAQSRGTHASSPPPARVAGTHHQTATPDPAGHHARYVSGAVCSASQLRLGKKIYGPAAGMRWTFDAKALIQFVRNIGPSCRFVLPSHLIVTDSTGTRRTIPVLPEAATGRLSFRVPIGAFRQIWIGASWPSPRQQGRFGACINSVRHPAAVSVPLGSSALHIRVPGLWGELCTAPSFRVPTIALAPVR